MHIIYAFSNVNYYVRILYYANKTLIPGWYVYYYIIEFKISMPNRNYHIK